MFITIRMVTQEMFRIEANPEDTVGDLKQKIEDAKNIPADDQKLVFGGKMLTDEETVKQLKINEKLFIVLMVAHKKQATSSQPAKVVAQTKVKSSLSQSQAKPVSKSTVSLQSSQSGAAAVEMSNEAKITSLVNMGFERDAAERALQVTENVVGEAVNILLLEENAADVQNVPKQVAAPKIAPQNQPQAAAVQLNAQERQVIERIVAMGFPQAVVQQMYLTCDKDENQTINLLLQQSEENEP